jgi:predicted DNA binding protein
MRMTTTAGELHGMVKLTNEQVLAIRSRYARRSLRGDRDYRITMGQLAKEYGVSKQQVLRILHREQWKHL